MTKNYFHRERKTWCGNYLEVKIIPRTSEQEKYNKSGKSRKKEKVSRPVQQTLNYKNTKRYYHFLAMGNFKEYQDYFFTGTYNNKYLPKTVKQAKQNLTNFIKRVKRLRKKKGLSELKYICVTEYSENADGSLRENTRFHHHMIINADGLTRKEIEECWKFKQERFGRANCQELKFDDEQTFKSLIEYMGKKKNSFSSSNNLVKPTTTKNDSHFSKRKIESLSNSNDHGREYYEKRYKDYFVKEIISFERDDMGWFVYLSLIRKDGNNQKERSG